MGNPYGYITGTIRWNSKVQRRRMQLAAKKSGRSLNGFMLVACEMFADQILGKSTNERKTNPELGNFPGLGTAVEPVLEGATE